MLLLRNSCDTTILLRYYYATHLLQLLLRYYYATSTLIRRYSCATTTLLGLQATEPVGCSACRSSRLKLCHLIVWVPTCTEHHVTIMLYSVVVVVVLVLLCFGYRLTFRSCSVHICFAVHFSYQIGAILLSSPLLPSFPSTSISTHPVLQNLNQYRPFQSFTFPAIHLCINSSPLNQTPHFSLLSFHIHLPFMLFSSNVKSVLLYGAKYAKWLHK
jgi:hypothetical protein